MKKTNYTPQAGDVCEWTYKKEKKEVIILSPELTSEGNYIAMDKYDIKLKDSMFWYCHINDLKLIYRP